MDPRGSDLAGPAPGVDPAHPGNRPLGAFRSDATARWLFIWPAVLVILLLSIFPLAASFVLALSNLVFRQGAIAIDFVGLDNFSDLLFGTERKTFLGVARSPTPLGWALVFGSIVVAVWWFRRAVRGGEVGPFGLAVRLGAGLVLVGFTWLLAQTLLGEGGRPGTLVVTMVFVVAGITLQYLVGLLLALLASRRVPGRRFFRVVFLIPLTITPVGVGYMLRMMTDTNMGPAAPLLRAIGMSHFTWVNDPWLARFVVILADSWQWIPFMFIVLLAAIEGQDQEVLEAAFVDGAHRRQAFWHMTVPAILPVSTTLILIRMIESFKMVDMPNILLGGGPGTATQTLALEAYFSWRTLDLGRSAAIAYLLLITVTIVATAYGSLVRRRAEAAAA
jgi:multiple sugar transport system permease protein